MDKRIEDVIKNAIDDANRYPFLFIGSGLSRRYMGIPSWEGLLEEVCVDVLESRFAYASYRAQAKTAVENGRATTLLPYVATLMEDDVNNALFTKDKFSQFREAHEAELVAGSSPFKLFVADVVSRHNMNSSDELQTFRDAGSEKIAGIITTNYDCMCEELFPMFKTYVGERDLLFSEQCFSQEIYKIHGSLEEPDSMVLTAADYAAFDKKRKYLAAKLLTIFVEYPVIFLGYSIQDENIQNILHEISECVPEDQLDRLQRRMIFVQHGDSTQINSHTLVFEGKSITMTRIETDDFSAIYGSLLSARKMYSTRMIREIRGSIFRLVERLDPTSDIVVSGVDNVLNNLKPDQKIVCGMAISPADIGKPIVAEDIFEDIVLDNLNYDPKWIVETYLNIFVRRNPNGMPVFKYVRDLDAGMVGKDIAAYLPTLTSVDSFRSKTIRGNMAAQRRRFEGSLSVGGLIQACAPNPAFARIPYLNEDEINVDELESYLKRALIQTEDDTEARKRLLKNSDYRKCIRIYDFLRYAPK